MNIHIATIFPEMCEKVLGESIIGRAVKSGSVGITCHNIRNFAVDKHKRVDDSPYSGGRGMVMMAEPIWQCFNCVTSGLDNLLSVYMSPKGKVLTQAVAKEFLKYENIFILCGHYEGVDQRVLDRINPVEISIGDYVVTGGELPALVLTDCICRMLPGVLKEDVCFTDESHWDGLLEYPQYTRPEDWNGMKVPEVLLSGHHKNIEEWKKARSLEITKKLRPDIL
ncbi:MAG: tRNA (guanosine(37)-N1)-methyltransferase TrmD [Ruminococcus sp.]|jgi:tRNA (guanine37-N1)-methyltransferase|nr:tRNA (guanosine(37)-N1)-methyltransferase TrmD [Ruminococcus sp.]